MSQNYEVFGKYILLEKIAQGGMAELYLAKTPSLGGVAKFLAIKRILPQYSDNNEFVEMFKDEAKIAVNLVHSNIATIHEFGIVENLFYLAMTYVEGANLRQVLNKMKKTTQNLLIEHVVFIVKEVAASLDFAHRCLDPTTAKPLGIIHRDMSPQNIMISFEGEVKIIDFGIAKATSQIENTRAGTLKGKFGYMSPEQAEGQVVDHRTDIFSLGIILWELLASDRLFVSNNEINTLRKVRNCQIPSLRKINPNIPVELESICQKALTRDRNLRYQSAAELHRDLTRFMNRQYPDFLPSDFRTFIKTLYAQEILNSRLKLVEYSKVVHTLDMVTDETTDVTATSTNTNDGPQTGRKNNLDTQRLDATENSKSGINFKELSIKKMDPLYNVELETANRFEMTNTMQTSTKSFTKNQNVVQIGRRVSKKKSSLKSSTLFLFFILFGISATLIHIFNKKEPNSIFNKLNFKNETPCDFGEDCTQLSSSSANSQQTPAHQIKVFIDSVPEGANIEIDGKKTGIITPATISVEKTQKKFVVALKKNGYLTYLREVITPVEMTSLKFTLQKEKLGYINVIVIPDGGAQLFIGDQEIKEKLPLSKYPVPAGIQFLIKAVNPYTGGTDQKYITVDHDKEQTIRLFPTIKRQPSDRDDKKIFRDSKRRGKN